MLGGSPRPMQGMLLTALQEGDAATRWAAERLLAELDPLPPDVGSALAAAARQDPSAQVRAVATRAIGRRAIAQRTPQLVAALLELSRDVDRSLRAAAPNA